MDKTAKEKHIQYQLELQNEMIDIICGEHNINPGQMFDREKTITLTDTTLRIMLCQAYGMGQLSYKMDIAAELMKQSNNTI